MSTVLRPTRSWRMSAWVNDVNPVNWKIVLVGYMQGFGVCVFWVGWLIDIIVCVIRKLPTDFHETAIGLVLGFLGALSGVNTYGRKVDRESDYGYLDKVNEGKRIEASKPAPTPQVNTGDGAQVNVTSTLPVPVAAVAPAATPVMGASKAIAIVPADEDAGLG